MRFKCHFPFAAEGNARPEEIDLLWELTKQVRNE